MVAAIATPFQVVDPYLAPVRDVIDVLRTPIPVISDLSELAGGDEVSLLSLLETLGGGHRQPQLELAHRVIGLVGGVTDDDRTPSAASAARGRPVGPRRGLAAVGALPRPVRRRRCTRSAPVDEHDDDHDARPAAHPDLVDGQEEPAALPRRRRPQQAQQTSRAPPARRPTRTATGTRTPSRASPEDPERHRAAARVLAAVPADPDQLIDVLTGEGEASYFRLDLGTLAAQVAYTQTLRPDHGRPGPDHAVRRRLDLGRGPARDGLRLLRADPGRAQLSHPGDVDALLDVYSTSSTAAT